MFVFRHKTLHLEFKVVLAISTLLHLMLMSFLFGWISLIRQ